MVTLVILSLLSVWEALGPYGGDMHFTFISSRGTVFLSHGFGGFWRSEDQGETWVHITPSDPLLNNSGIYAIVEVLTDQDTFLFAAGSRGLWMSEDDGLSWTRVETGDPLIDESEAHLPVSIDAWGDTLLFLGMQQKLNTGTPFNGWILIQRVGAHWEATRFPIPGEPGPWITRLDFSPTWPDGPTLFAASFTAGLFSYRFVDGAWLMDTLPLPSPSSPTGVRIDERTEALYLMTSDDSFYRGIRQGGTWVWEHIDPVPDLVGNDKPTAYDIQPDPFDPYRLWFGMGGRMAAPIPSHAPSSRLGVFFWDTTGDSIAYLQYQSGWGLTLAVSVDTAHAVPTPYGTGIGAGLAFAPSYSSQCVLRTTDGGATWRRKFWGANGQTTNRPKVIRLRDGTSLLVNLAVSANGLSFDYGATWDTTRWFFVYTTPTDMTGYNWDALGIPPSWPTYTRSTPFGVFEDDILIASGEPARDLVGGLFRGSTEALTFINHERLPSPNPGFSLCFTQLTPEPVFRALLNPYDSSMVLLAEQVGGIGVYNGILDLYHRFGRGLPNPGGTWADSTTWALGGVRLIEVAEISSDTFYFVATMEGPWVGTEFDMPFEFPSRIFRAKNLRFTLDSIACEEAFIQIWPPSPGTQGDSAIVGLSAPRDGSGRLLAISASGRLLYTENAQASPVTWKTLRILPSEPSPLTDEPPQIIWDMAVDWTRGLIFLSAFHYGVLVGFLEEVEAAVPGSEILFSPYNDGLYCLEPRPIFFDPISGFLFAGTQGRSLFRTRPELPGIEERKLKPTPAFTVLHLRENALVLIFSSPLQKRERLRLWDTTGRLRGSWTLERGTRKVRLSLPGPRGVYLLTVGGRHAKVIKL